MYNSKYTGQQVEALLDSVSGKTIYTQGSGITIDGGVISMNASGYVTTEQFESLEEAVANALLSSSTDLSAYYTSAETLNAIATASAATMTAVEGKNYVTSSDLSIYYTAQQTNEAIAAASGNTISAVDAKGYITSADTQSFLTSADTLNFVTTADTANFITSADTVTVQQFDSLEEAVANALISGVTKEDLAQYYTSAETLNAISTASGATVSEASGVTMAEVASNYMPLSEMSNYYTKQGTDNAIAAASAATMTAVDGKGYSTFSGSYNDLTDKPTIPTVPTNVSDFTNDAGYVTSAQTVSIAQFDSLEEAVANALLSSVTQDDIKDFITSADTADFITSESLSGYTTAAQFTAHTENTDIHVTSADKTAWNAKSDFSGSYNDLTDKPTIPTVPSNVSDFNNDAGYITSADTANFVTSTQFDSLEEAVANALISAVTQDDLANYLTSADTVNYYTSAETMTAIANASASTVAEASGVTMAAVANGYTPLSDMSNYYTKTQTDSAIATASGATVTAIEGMNYATTAVTSSLESRIAALEALLLVTGVNSAYTVVQMTEAEYSAATKNANTIYYVVSGATV